MTDLEMTALCAEAMGYQRIEHSDLARPGISAGKVSVSTHGTSMPIEYDPLRDDSQAMALVKKFGLSISARAGDVWEVYSRPKPIMAANLNRAIVECCARMQEAKR